MNINDLRQKKREELVCILNDLKKALLSLRIKKVVKSVHDTSVFSKNKKDIARIMTVLMECKDSGGFVNE